MYPYTKKYIDDRRRQCETHVKSDKTLTNRQKGLAIDEIRRQERDSRVQPGENVGMVLASALCERLTQSTLSSFHHSGLQSSAISTGVPLMNMILSASKDERNAIITCEPNFEIEHADERGIAEIRARFGDTLLETKLWDIVLDMEPCYINTQTSDPWLHSFGDGRAYVRVTLDMEIVIRRHIPFTKIMRTFSEALDNKVSVTSGPIRMATIDLVGTSTMDMDDVTKRMVKHVISGMKGVKEISIMPDNDRISGFHLDIRGGNFLDVISHPLVRKQTVHSTSMWHYLKYLGVEATFEVISQKIKLAIDSSGPISDRHVHLLADAMCLNGTISSVSRYGIRDKKSPLGRASFEESVENLIKSGVYTEKEELLSVSSNLMTARVSRSGTGLNDLLYKECKPRAHKDTKSREFKNLFKYLISTERTSS